MAETGVKSVLNWTVGIAAVAFVLLITIILFGNLSGNSGITDRQNPVSVANETTATIEEAGYILSGFNSSWSSISITSATNSSNGTVILPAYYTLDQATGNLTATGATEWTGDDSVWLTYTYTNTQTSQAETQFEIIIANYSTGAVNTSAQFPTVGTILGVALLILILLALLVYVIVKMSGAAISGSGSKGGTFSQGGDFA